LKELFDNYVREVSRRTKGESKVAHDERAARIFTEFFGAGKKAAALNIRDWDDFIVARRAGKIGPNRHRLRPVRDRQIEYDLKFLLAVLNWVTKAQTYGEPLLDHNPLKGLRLPRSRTHGDRRSSTSSTSGCCRWPSRSTGVSRSRWYSHTRRGTA
jgi:hypothetical protein